MTSRGFTIVELIITITIMGILLTLAVVNLTSTQVSARDTERRIDVETISNNLESFYKNGVPSSTTIGRYPSLFLVSNGETSVKSLLLDIDLKSATAPGATSVATSFVAATNASAQTPTVTQYIYQPLKADGTLCGSEAEECRKFNIYYRLETDNSIQKVTSKNQ